MINQNYYSYIHKNPQIKTFGEFVNNNDTPMVDGITIGELYHYTLFVDPSLPGPGITNKDLIFEKYSKEEKEKYSSYPIESLPLRLYTQIAIPKKNLVSDSLLTQGNFRVRTSDAHGFLASEMKRILEKQPNVLKSRSGSTDVATQHIGADVKMWCRGYQSDSFLNLSPFIQSLNVTYQEQQGVFDMLLAPITGDYKNGRWNVDFDTVKFFTKGDPNKVYNAVSSLHKVKDGKIRRNKFLFQYLINPNDLVYIRLEGDSKSAGKIEVGNHEIPSTEQNPKDYDMIALVDSVRTYVDPSSGEASVMVSGRDLTKVLIEDGCYFFPLEFARGIVANAGFANSISQADDSFLVSRSFASGELLSLVAFTERSIAFSLDFVCQQMSNTGLVPNSVFDGYEKSDLTINKALKDGEVRVIDRQGVWRIIKLVIDKSVEQLLIADSSIAQSQGSILNYFTKVCQEPLVQFYTDTYGDQFYFVVRRPPFDRQKMVDIVFNEYVETEAPFINSRINGDEYRGNRYNTVQELPVDFSVSELVVDLNERDIMMEELGFDDSEVYTWFRLDPRALWFGQGSEVSLSFLPAIFLEEYAKIWGARSMDITSNYFQHQSNQSNESDVEMDSLEMMALYDLKYLIDCHAYLPFSRKGTIVTKLDRRIRKHSFIYHKGTGEVYYVRSVSHNVQAGQTEATTRLTVERGLVKDFIKGKLIDGVVYSYFDIVNTKIKSFNVDSSASDEILRGKISGWGVDKDQFDFFFNKNQFNYV